MLTSIISPGFYMRKQITFLALFIMFSLHTICQQKIDVDKQFAMAAKQYESMLASHPDLTKFPQSTKPDGSRDDRKSSWWCSGFFGGSPLVFV
jgi:hypothetical protein